MNKTTIQAIAFGQVLFIASTANAWISYLDGSEDPQSILDTPWLPYANEGTVAVEDLGGGNFALRLDSPAHSDPELPDPDPNVVWHANEFYTFRDEMGVPTENVGAARFRLVDFSPTGKENLLSVAINGGIAMAGTPVAPSITLVDGKYWVWSYTSNVAILELGPAVAGEWHEAYVMARNNGTAQVWWDGDMVLDGPVPEVADFADYVEFGSGTYWQTTAASIVDFDWVGWGELSDMPVPPGIVGDYNDNGTVDAADYVVWRKNLDTTNALPHDPVGGTIGAGQYDNWRTHFGESIAAPIAAAVPEPSSIGLVAACVCGWMVARRRVSNAPARR